MFAECGMAVESCSTEMARRQLRNITQHKPNLALATRLTPNVFNTLGSGTFPRS